MTWETKTSTAKVKAKEETKTYWNWFGMTLELCENRAARDYWVSAIARERSHTFPSRNPTLDAGHAAIVAAAASHERECAQQPERRVQHTSYQGTRPVPSNSPGSLVFLFRRFRPPPFRQNCRSEIGKEKYEKAFFESSLRTGFRTFSLLH